jgi:hypothetical protein
MYLPRNDPRQPWPTTPPFSGVLGGLVLLLLTFVVLCGCSLCRGAPWSVVPSPDRTRIALVYERTCRGGDVTVEVSILPTASEASGAPGNLASFAWRPGVKPVEGPTVFWGGPGSLTVSYWSPDFTLSRKLRLPGIESEFIVSTPLDDQLRPHR